MKEYKVLTTTGPVLISAPSQKDASDLAVKDGRTLHNAEHWLQALESGEFKQSQGILCRKVPNGWAYCCLGVGCEVAEQHGVTIRRATDEDKRVRCDDIGRILGGSLDGQPDVKTWLGLRENTGAVCYPDGRVRNNGVHLATLNDDQKLPFPEIAQIIRANPEKYLVNC
jgi:hypothetical protein